MLYMQKLKSFTVGVLKNCGRKEIRFTWQCKLQSLDYFTLLWH